MNKEIGIGSEVILEEKYCKNRVVKIIGETPSYWKTEKGLFSKQDLAQRGNYYNRLRVPDDEELKQVKQDCIYDRIKYQLGKTDWNKVSNENLSKIFSLVTGMIDVTNENAFFEKQMIGGCNIEVFGTYEEGKEWLHISFSRKSKLPTYADLQLIKREFLGNDKKGIMVFPEENHYVNICKNCLHLFYSIENPLPDFDRYGSI